MIDDTPGPSGATGSSGANRTGPATADPRIQEGIDHLQRAAREVIAASRALLDVAEELVEDPHAAGDVGRFVASLAGQAQRWTGPLRRPAGPTGEDPDGEPPVQRIPVS